MQSIFNLLSHDNHNIAYRVVVIVLLLLAVVYIYIMINEVFSITTAFEHFARAACAMVENARFEKSHPR